MEFDVSKANSTIVLPFESAINDATNVSQLEAAVHRFSCSMDAPTVSMVILRHTSIMTS